MSEIKIKVCFGTSCVARGAREVLEALKAGVADAGIAGRVVLERGCCGALCHLGPVVRVEPGGTVYGRVSAGDAGDIIEQHLVGGRVVDRLAVSPEPGGDGVPALAAGGFFQGQVLIAMRNRGRIDSESLEDYIANEGYLALAKALTRMEPEEVLAEVKRSGLRGRGGAGFPTGIKWEICRSSPGPDGKYVICNADEGDPGAFMDRSLLESDPHAVIEGLALGARAIGANLGYVYVREEYPLA
jgi:(2Fe-2S) ferredoxin